MLQTTTVKGYLPLPASQHTEPQSARRKSAKVAKEFKLRQYPLRARIVVVLRFALSNHCPIDQTHRDRYRHNDGLAAVHLSH